jgi:Glycosyl transferase family 2
MTPPSVICVMPVKNEAWILPRSLAAASLWADRIIVADQGSTDGSREIARSFPKVTLLANRSPHYSERERQQFLLEAARQFPEPRVIFALDADEILAGTWRDNPEWAQILSSAAGTAVRFPKAELLPGMRAYGVHRGGDPVHGLVDDGTRHLGVEIHSPRLPIPDPRRMIRPKSLWLLHFKATDVARNEAKHRWYQCWEHVRDPSKRPITLFRQYHRDLELSARPIRVEPEWSRDYEAARVDIWSSAGVSPIQWNTEVLRLFRTHGVGRFSKLDVFGGWWKGIVSDEVEVTPCWPYDPRTAFERRIHRWLRETQTRSHERGVRSLQRSLIPLGW